MNTRIAGFTLLEVLIALAILAISALAVIGQTASSLANLATLETKTVALVMAENQLNLATVADAFPATGRSTQSVVFNQQQWWIHTEVSSTSEPWLRKVEVSVSTSDNGDNTLVNVISYRGKF